MWIIYSEWKVNNKLGSNSRVGFQSIWHERYYAVVYEAHVTAYWSAERTGQLWSVNETSDDAKRESWPSSIQLMTDWPQIELLDKHSDILAPLLGYLICSIFTSLVMRKSAEIFLLSSVSEFTVPVV